MAIDRQERLASLVISRLQTTIALDQESVTVWDDAVLALRNGRDRDWLDYNLGSWMNSYFGHDGAFVLNPEGELVYAFSGGRVDSESAFAAMHDQVSPLIDDLRRRMRNGETEGAGPRLLSPGAADIAVVLGHPAVVSVKPVVSDSGEIEQAPGEEFLHIAVRYLDGDFLSELQGDYLFEGMRFAWRNNADGTESALPLVSASGEVVGYLIWQPYKPGAAVLTSMAPLLLGILALVVAVMSVLLFVLHQRSNKLNASEARLRYLALHDPLTGLPNRALFNERLDQALRQAPKTGGMVAVLYLDLDRFKQVNDTLGHPAGDLLIDEFGKRLRKLTRTIDTVARIGGDEFTMVIPRLEHMKSVEGLCERIIDTVRQPFEIEGQLVFVSVSIGVAVAPSDAEERIELTRKADIALYHAKNAGRNGYAIFGAAMDAIVQERQVIEQDLRLAMTRHGEIQVHYQPLYGASDMRITGAEALVRWNHPKNGWIPPSIFVPIAEETGLVDALGEFVLREACAAASAWPEHLTLSVNVSAVELRNPAFVDRVRKILTDHGFPPKRLELEVTETALSGNADTAEKNVNALRTMGVGIALDDFGTGFSSFSRLQKLKVDRIKIDRSFVNGIGRLGGDEAIVQAIVDLARAKGLKTTAEGVETSEHGEYLKLIGCDELQGFLYSRPVAPQQLDGLLGVKQPEKRTASAA